MSHFTDQLPTPITFAPVPAPVPAPAGPATRRPRRSAMALVAGVAVVAAGIAGWRASQDDGKGVAPTATDGVAGSGSITNAELSAAYSATFGVAATQPTLDCIAGQIGGAGSQADRLARGERLTLAEAEQAFTPFMSCAPDADFLTLMVPAAVQALGGSADDTCISDYFLTFGVAARAEARALALVSSSDFAASLQSTFAGCVI